MRQRDIESRGEKSNRSYASEDGDRNWISWLVPVFVVVNVILFLVEMYLNNCLRQVKHEDYSFGDGDDKYVGRFLGRFSFQPLGENPLFGSTASTDCLEIVQAFGEAINSPVNSNNFQRRKASCVIQIYRLQTSALVTEEKKGFLDRERVSDRWSSRVLWLCAIGSAVGLYMVAVDRQLKNREQMMAAEASAAESGANRE